jgi:hypothetical protein
MDDTAFQRYFTQPSHTYQRQYEALRAVIVEGRSQKDVAETFGFKYHSLRQLLYVFRQSFDEERTSAEFPFFKMSTLVGPSRHGRSPRFPQSRIAKR